MNTATTLRPVASLNATPTMSTTQMQHMIQQLMEQNAALQAKANVVRRITLKVSEKGGLSVYGLGRFPVTLYKEQWERLLGEADNIRQFMADNDATLKNKGDA